MRQRIKSILALAQFYNSQEKYKLSRDISMTLMDDLRTLLSFHINLDRIKDNDPLKIEKRRRCKIKSVRKALLRSP